MIENEEKKHHWLKIAAIIAVSFVVAYLAFYLALEKVMRNLTSPFYNAKHIEKMIKHHQREFKKFDEYMLENPFEPRMRPMLVNLVKENEEYKVIVDLKPLDGNENNINVDIKNNVVSINGKFDKRTGNGEKIISFSQEFYLDEKLDIDKITKEKRGDKYIITIPFDD